MPTYISVTSGLEIFFVDHCLREIINFVTGGKKTFFKNALTLGTRNYFD